MSNLLSVFDAPLLNPYGEGMMSLRDLVTQCQAIHLVWTPDEVLDWIDEHGHIDHLASFGHLPEDCRPALLVLVKVAMADNIGSAAR
ncbi:hypothetical protein ACGF0J_14210 [Nonomuraea sp. NPDC047897]|uniref:hypothetical protein n=1 Tax=Nonomuraea sp. NPDC047897 TaxID=3364346 RepID=UPI00371A3419